jgi:hypothetical protein
MATRRTLNTHACSSDDTLSGQIDAALNDGVCLRLHMSLLNEIPWSTGAILQEADLPKWVDQLLGTPVEAEGSLIPIEGARLMEKARSMIKV